MVEISWAEESGFILADVNFVIGNIDLPNDLVCFPMVLWVGVPGAEHILPESGKFRFLF